jgi:hypothetical protein
MGVLLALVLTLPAQQPARDTARSDAGHPG